MSKQDIFDEAVKKYDELASDVKAIGTVWKENVEAEYDIKNGLVELDMIIQGILLQVAFADKEFNDMEIEFIEKITTYGDLMAFLNAVYPLESGSWNWDTFKGKVDRRTINELIDLINEKALDDIYYDFMKKFVAVDVSTKYDFYESFVNKVFSLCAALSFMDSSSTSDEKKASIKALKDNFTYRYNEVVKCLK